MRGFFNKYFFILLLICTLIICSQCNKKDDLPDTIGVILVKYSSDSSTVVPGANVIISKYDINVSGVTDIFGEFKNHFNAEAILDVKVSKDVAVNNSTSTSTLIGSGTIRLEQGKSVTKTIYLY